MSDVPDVPDVLEVFDASDEWCVSGVSGVSDVFVVVVYGSGVVRWAVGRDGGLLCGGCIASGIHC